MAASLQGCGGNGSPTLESDFAAIRAELNNFMNENHFPGLEVAIVLDGKLAYNDALGVKSANTGEAMTPDTVVPTGSIAVKLLIASESIRLAREDKLDLDEKVTDVLPWLALPEGSANMTFQDAFDMYSGLSSPLRTQCADPSLKAALARITEIAPPGNVWVYSSTGFSIGAAAIEQIEQRAFEDVLRDHFLDPTGMSGTFDASVAMDGDHSSSHVIADDGTATAYELNALPHCAAGVDCSKCEDFRANAGLFLGAKDLARLVEHALAQQAPFDAATLDTLETRGRENGWGQGYRYGYGLFSLDVKGAHFNFAITEYAGVTGTATWADGTGFGVVLLGNGMPKNGMALPGFQREAVSIATRLLHLTGPEPDLTTPPSTWAKYAGSYMTRSLSRYDVTLAADNQLQIANALWPDPGVATMTQGGGYAWGAGDTFQFVDPLIQRKREVTFYAGSEGGGAMQYLLDQGASGSPFLLAKCETLTPDHFR